MKTKRIQVFNTCTIKFSWFAPNNANVLMEVPWVAGHISDLYSGSVSMAGVPATTAALIPLSDRQWCDVNSIFYIHLKEDIQECSINAVSGEKRGQWRSQLCQPIFTENLDSRVPSQTAASKRGIAPSCWRIPLKCCSSEIGMRNSFTTSRYTTHVTVHSAEKEKPLYSLGIESESYWSWDCSVLRQSLPADCLFPRF